MKVDGVGRDDDAGVVVDGKERGRDKVGVGLAGARARLDHQMLAGGERIADSAQHFHLLLAVLVRLVVLGEGTAVFEQRGDLFYVQGDGVFVTLEGSVKCFCFEGVQRAIAAIGMGFASADRLTGLGAKRLLENPARAPLKRLAEADELGDEVDGQFECHVEELQEDRMGDSSVVEGAVSGGK